MIPGTSATARTPSPTRRAAGAGRSAIASRGWISLRPCTDDVHLDRGPCGGFVNRTAMRHVLGLVMARTSETAGPARAGAACQETTAGRSAQPEGVRRSRPSAALPRGPAPVRQLPAGSRGHRPSQRHLLSALVGLAHLGCRPRRQRTSSGLHLEPHHLARSVRHHTPRLGQHLEEEQPPTGVRETPPSPRCTLGAAKALCSVEGRSRLRCY